MVAMVTNDPSPGRMVDGPVSRVMITEKDSAKPQERNRPNRLGLPVFWVVRPGRLRMRKTAYYAGGNCVMVTGA